MASGASPPVIPGYLMEGADEAVRLRTKERAEATAGQLQSTGFDALGPRPHVIDAGTGAGAVALQMARLASLSQMEPTITLLDRSAHRLAAARGNLSAYSSIEQQYIGCYLEAIPLPSESVDYIFCRFVFEYVADQKRVFAELDRILKPGGQLVIGDLDHNCLNHYPLASDLQAQLDELVREVERATVFDFFAGRKLYSYFFGADYLDLSVQMYAHHLFYGALSPADDYNWTAKLDRLSALQRENLLNLSFDAAEFRDRFMKFLRSPGRFSYTPLLLVAGTKP